MRSLGLASVARAGRWGRGSNGRKLGAFARHYRRGLKLGWSFAWRSLLAAELLFVSMSLGHLLSLGRDLNDVSQVIAIMLVIVALGMTIDRLVFGWIEARVRERWGLG